jgi:DNA-binding MarR family transcriptional regulator
VERQTKIKVSEIVKEVLEYIRPEFERKLKEKLEEYLNFPIEEEKPRKRAVSTKKLILGIFLLKGGRATSTEIAEMIKKFDVTSKTVSGYLSKMTKQGLLNRVALSKDSSASYHYSITDWFQCINAVKSEKAVYEFVIKELKGNLLSKHLFASGLFTWYLKTKGTVHIRNEFIKECLTKVGEDFKQIVEEVLPAVLAELKAKGIIELTKGLDGINVDGQPIALATYLVR